MQALQWLAVVLELAVPEKEAAFGALASIRPKNSHGVGWFG